MFIKSIEVENFKGYHGTHSIDFNVPDGITEGSGLNIFVGENNSGKSTIFEALDFIKDNTKKEPASLVNKSDPANILNNMSVCVTYTGNITASVNSHVQDNKRNSFSNKVYVLGGVEYFLLDKKNYLMP